MLAGPGKDVFGQFLTDCPELPKNRRLAHRLRIVNKYGANEEAILKTWGFANGSRVAEKCLYSEYT
jgi:hypothetical protein